MSLGKNLEVRKLSLLLRVAALLCSSIPQKVNTCDDDDDDYAFQRIVSEY